MPPGRNEGGNDSRNQALRAAQKLRFYTNQKPKITGLSNTRPIRPSSVDIFGLPMTFRSVISVLLSLALALASPLGWASPLIAATNPADACQPASSCPCCEGAVCPCAGEAPKQSPEAPAAPRPTTDLRVDIAPVPFRTIVLISPPVARSIAMPAARRSAARDGVRSQASLCIWRT